MIRYLTILLLFALPIAALQAQSMSWRKHAKLADELYEKGKFGEAAKHYHAAWEQKQRKRELIYKAGNCYSKVRDYANAALAYQNALEKAKKFPDVRLKYGRALKQAGQYTEASKQMANYLDNYKGNDRAEVAQMIETEIQGCELGIQLLGNEKNKDIELAHLSNIINTSENEFGPIPFTDEILYYSSTKSGRAQIYRTQKINGEWSKPIVPATFPEITEEHFCNGTLTPDNKRFYFTICETEASSKGPANRCEIYVIKRLGNIWSTPERLRDYINIKGATITHPFVVYAEDKEILYFASNRMGGYGGLDIWYVTRDINSSGMDFSFPENAGAKINTEKDEITPFYDQGNKMLFFSSNGHVSIGGFDIYKSEGHLNTWSKPVHAGIPFNSSADDMHYVKTPSGLGGFLVSNRTFDNEKKTTTHNDIFSFSLEKVANVVYAIEGTVFGRATGAELAEATATLYDVTVPGERRFVNTTSTTASGIFTFKIDENKVYEVEVSKEGYLPSSILLDPAAEESPSTTFFESFFLDTPAFEGTGPDLGENTVIEDGTPPADLPPGKVKDNFPRKDPYTEDGQTKEESSTIVAGEYYKVQIAAVRTFDADNPLYDVFREDARIESEFLSSKNLNRVLLADFNDLERAREMRQRAINNGFPQAYIVRYVDGERKGIVK